MVRFRPSRGAAAGKQPEGAVEGVACRSTLVCGQRLLLAPLGPACPQGRGDGGRGGAPWGGVPVSPWWLPVFRSLQGRGGIVELQYLSPGRASGRWPRTPPPKSSDIADALQRAVPCKVAGGGGEGTPPPSVTSRLPNSIVTTRGFTREKLMGRQEFLHGVWLQLCRSPGLVRVWEQRFLSRRKKDLGWGHWDFINNHH